MHINDVCIMFVRNDLKRLSLIIDCEHVMIIVLYISYIYITRKMLQVFCFRENKEMKINTKCFALMTQ